MSTRTRLRALFMGGLVSMLASITAHADTAADQAFIQRLVARQVIAGVAAQGDTATIRALAPFAGADNASMSDVARVVLRIQDAEAAAQGKPPAVVNVIVRHPDGRVIATFSDASGLVRS